MIPFNTTQPCTLHNHKYGKIANAIVLNNGHEDLFNSSCNLYMFSVEDGNVLCINGKDSHNSFISWNLKLESPQADSRVDEGGIFDTEMHPITTTHEKISLEHLCIKMKEQGFTYACLTDVTSPKDAATHTLGQFMKPGGNVLFFSSLEEYQVSDNETEKEVVPDWVQWVRMEGGESFESRYKTKNILFINDKDLENIANQDEAERKLINPFRFDWIAIGKQYNGINVSKPYKSPVWHGWDIPTIAIWKSSIISNSCFYSNAGEWTYNPSPVAWPSP